MSHKYVYLFKEGNGSMRELLGGKGANLAEMTNLGMPVPYGFTVSTEACTRYYDDGKKIGADIEEQIYAGLAELEKQAGKKFGDFDNPLLVSVRSGARASMPGMMDTILNLGLNDTVVEGLAKKTDNPRFAYDSYRRFVQMFSDVVMELSKKRFEEIIDAKKAEKGVKLDTELTAEDLKLVNIVDGDTVRIGSEELEVVDVPGHTKGSVVFFYKDYIFTGDAVGSGDLFMMEATTDTYLPSLEHFMAEVLLRNEDVDYELLTGHWENLNPFSVEYLRHMLILVKGVIRGDIPIGYYTRKPGRWAGYLDANIFYPYAVLSYENEK